MTGTGLNSPKKVIENQKYEKYWKSTLALTDFFGDQFIRTLEMMVNHIDKYHLADCRDDELILDLSKKNKKFNQEIAHAKELENQVFSVFENNSLDGSSTRKQLNTLVKLGFVKPYLKGYVPAAKEYVKSNISEEERVRLFSDTVYQYASFNSSQTNDDTENNQVKFLVNTLLNKADKKLTMDEFIGIMQMNVQKSNYATDKQISQNKNWAGHIGFYDRKYNQVNHLKLVLKNMNLFEVITTKNKVGAKKNNEFFICLAENASEFIPVAGSTKRDTYRFAIMRKAVIEESIRTYGKKISWLSKQESEGMVVSHIYESAEALKVFNLEAAYDPNNALYLKPGNEDQYFDKHKMTFDKNGLPIFSDEVSEEFIAECIKNQYHLDSKILNPQRLGYILKYHHDKFRGTIK